jgi:multiple sugar transport system substrate-binding protein
MLELTRRRLLGTSAAIAGLALAAPRFPRAQGGTFTLADIPELSNKRPIHVALEAGGAADLIIPYLQRFAEHTGVPVTTESMVFATLYSKEIVELQGRTGAYDLVVTETSWTNEWQDFLYPMDELAEQYDPDGVAGLEAELAGHDQGLLRMCSTREGKLMGLPYYTYTMINIYRRDVFEDATEQAAFADKYGYDLVPAETWQQLRDQAEFFTRKAGETLKGETLTKDIYGLSLMAGRYPHVQDEVTAMLWGEQGRWARTIRDGDGAVTGFQTTEEDMATLEESFALYRDLMQFTPPGTDNAFWDFATAQFVDGNTIMMPTMYASLWNWASDVRDKVPGALAGAAPVVGMRPYTGAFHFSPSRDSKNPEAAYWCLKYIASYENQREMVEKGWCGVRRDVLENPDYADMDRWYKEFGWVQPVLETWDAQLEDVNSYLHFNSRAFGKLYEEMTIIGHENATGVKSPADAVAAWQAVFKQHQNRFDDAKVVEG